MSFFQKANGLSYITNLYILEGINVKHYHRNVKIVKSQEKTKKLSKNPIFFLKTICNELCILVCVQLKNQLPQNIGEV